MDTLGCLAITSLTLGIVAMDLSKGTRRLHFSLGNPRVLLEVFFALYSTAPLLVLFLTDGLPEGLAIPIAACFLLGLLCLRAGLGKTRGSSCQIDFDSLFYQREATALMAFGSFGSIAVGFFFLSRAAEGSFFTHAEYYEQATTIGAGLRDVLGQALRLPTLLVLGAAAISRRNRHRDIAWRMAMAYAAAVGALLALSSQVRPAVTVILLGAAIWTSRKHKGEMTLRQAAILGMVAFVVAGFVLRVRRFSSEFVNSGNQLQFAIQRSIGLAVEEEPASAVTENAVKRGAGTVELMGIFMDVVPRHGYLLLSGFGGDLSALVPRVLWPEKPVVTKGASSILMNYHIPVFDAPLGPVLEGFVRGGWVGVAIELYALGIAFRWLTRIGRGPGKGARYLAFALVFGASLDFEDLNLLSWLGHVRTALIGLIVYEGLVLLFRVMKNRNGARSAGEIRRTTAPRRLDAVRRRIECAEQGEPVG